MLDVPYLNEGFLGLRSKGEAGFPMIRLLSDRNVS